MKGFEKNLNLIEVIDFQHINENISVLVIEKCECSLYDKLLQYQRDKQFSFKQLLQIIFDLLDGLILLKTYKIIHLDIKPQNVLVNKSGIYIFSDFGTSLKNEENEKEKIVEVKGYTTYYAPKEITQQEYKFNYQSDVFSLGKTLSVVFDYYLNIQNQSESEKKQVQSFQKIVLDNAIQNEISKRKTCLELHKLFYEAVALEENPEFVFSYVDKIRMILLQSKHDANKDIYFYNEISIYYNQKILELQQKIKRPHFLRLDPQNILIYYQIADFFNEQSKPKDAKEYMLKSYDLCNQIYKKEHLYTANTLNMLGQFNLKYDGLDYSLKSIEMIDKILKGDCNYKAIYQNTLSWCNESISNIKEAIKKQEESLRIRENIFIKDHKSIATAYNNLGSMYQNVDIKKSLVNELKSLEIRKKIFDQQNPCIARSLDCVGYCYLKMNDLEKARQYLVESYNIRKRLYQNDIDCKAVSIRNITKLCYKEGQLKESLSYYKKYFQMVENLKYEDDQVYMCLYNMAKCYFNLNLYQDSFENLQAFLKINLNNPEKIIKAHNIISVCKLRIQQRQSGLKSICKSITVDEQQIQQDICKQS